MTDVNLTQSEADALIAMKKYRVNEIQWDYPSLGGTVSIPLRSEDKRDPQGAVHMMAEMQTLIDKYVAWLKDKTSLRQVEDWIEITTPYLDRHNDYLQIYARRLNGGYLLTDDGYVLEDLQQSGCKIESPKRQALLKMTLGGIGCMRHGTYREGVKIPLPEIWELEQGRGAVLEHVKSAIEELLDCGKFTIRNEGILKCFFD